MHQRSKLTQPTGKAAFVDLSSADQLPHEIAPHFNYSQLLFLFTGMLMMVITINFLVIIFLGRYSTNFGYFLSHQKWELLKRLDDPVQWLILGDSSANQGVDPAIIENELGGEAVNLGTNGDMTTMNDLWMLDYYIKKFGPPENVLIVHVYDIWYRDFNPVLFGQLPLPWGFWKESNVTNNLVWNREIQRDILLEHYVPIYSQNRTLGNIIEAALFDFKNPFQTNWKLDPNGYLPAYDPKPETVVADGSDHIQFTDENNFEISDLNQKAMEEFIRLADRYGFNLYLVLGPQYEGMIANPDFRDYLDSVMEQLSQFDAQSEHVYFISDVKTFSADQMQTADHVIDSGAREYTQWLVAQIHNLR